MNSKSQITISCNDIDINNALIFASEFCLHASKFLQRPSEEVMVLLNRTASFGHKSIAPELLNPTHLEIAQFFINLHEVLIELPVESEALFSTLALLQHFCINTEIRQLVIEEYRFIPVITTIFKRAYDTDKVYTLLKLLQNLTFGIQVTWEEPYIIELLNMLVKITKRTGIEENMKKRISLSILINLCHKNYVVLLLFQHSYNISEFTQVIQNQGVMTYQMLLILSEDVYSPSLEDLFLFLSSTFSSIAECLKSSDSLYLHHLVEFIIESESNRLLTAKKKYRHYNDDINECLNKISFIITHNKTPSEPLKACVSQTFRLMAHLCEYINESNEKCYMKTLANLVSVGCDCLTHENFGIDAGKLLNKLFELSDTRDIVSAYFLKNSVHVSNIIMKCTHPHTVVIHITVLLQLLYELLHHKSTEQLILNEIKEPFFDRMLIPLLILKVHNLKNAIAKAEIEKTIQSILLLTSFSKLAGNKYLHKCVSIFKLKSIPELIAIALSGNYLTCNAVFKISQLHYFPTDAVAKEINKLNNYKLCDFSTKFGQKTNIFKSYKTFINKEYEERLQSLVTSLMHSNMIKPIQNIEVSKIIELFNFQILKYRNVEQCLCRRLEQSSNEISSLTKRINLQNAELQKFYNMCFERQIRIESLEARNRDYVVQKDTLKRSASEFMKKLSERTEALQLTEKRLSVKLSECITLQNHLDNARQELMISHQSLATLQKRAKDQAERIDKFKKSLVAFEEADREKQEKIVCYVQSVELLKRDLQIQFETTKKSKDMVSVLETQLQEKNELIRGYEIELSETEEMRRTIINLMESKKSKRKL